MLIPRDEQQLLPRQAPPPAAFRLPDWAQILLFGFVGAGVAAGAIALALAIFGGAYARAGLALEAPKDERYADVEDLPHRLDKVEKRLTSYAPKREIYVVVDTHRNRLAVRR